MLRIFNAHRRRRSLRPKNTLYNVKVSDAAKKELRLARKSARKRYKEALEDAWKQIDQTISQISVAHHKSYQAVQMALHMGRRQLTKQIQNKTSHWNAFQWWQNTQQSENRQDLERNSGGPKLLPELAKNCALTYHELSEDEKAKILDAFEQHKLEESKSIQPSVKSRVADIRHTVNIIEKELSYLETRSGIQSQMFLTRGTTDLSLTGIAYCSSSMQNFQSEVYKIDEQDYINRMEGYALLGLKGAASNAKKRLHSMKATVRKLIEDGLAAAATRPENGKWPPKMEYTHYWTKVVHRYKVVLEGWPEELPFKNLSEIGTNMSILENLHERYKSGVMYWRPLTDRTLQQLEEEQARKKRDQERTHQRTEEGPAHQVNDGEIVAPLTARGRNSNARRGGRAGGRVCSAEAVNENEADKENGR